MGGPKEGWTVYARNVHSAAGGIQDRMNVYLRTQLGMQRRQVEAWARQHPGAILDHLRQFYKAEGIGFPY